MVSHVNSRRLLQDMGSLGLFGSGLLVLRASLQHYLAGLSRPMPMMASFALVLALACFYEWKAARWSRHTVAMWAVQAWIFALAALVAPLLRGELLDILRQVGSLPNATALIGVEYKNAMTMPVIGYGGCFTLGLALCRWLSLPALRALVFHLVLPLSERASRCPHCGQPA